MGNETAYRTPRPEDPPKGTIGERQQQPKELLRIEGSRHVVILKLSRFIRIGCRTGALSYWRENASMLGDMEGYSDQEVREYTLHVDHVEKFMRLYGLLETTIPVASEPVATKGGRRKRA